MDVILFQRSELSSLDLPVLLCVGQPDACCQANPFYDDFLPFLLCMQKLPAEVDHEHWQEVKNPRQIGRHLETSSTTKWII